MTQPSSRTDVRLRVAETKETPNVLRMAWQIEHWWGEVFPGVHRVFEEYQDLSPRELAIVAAAVLDLALVDLISRRFIDEPKESEKFLGADENGRAPAGSFGARIQLALLLGIITKSDAAILRAIKGIRNAFAHRARVNYCDERVLKFLRILYDELRGLVRPKLPPSSSRDPSKLGRLLERHPEVGASLLLAMFGAQQQYFAVLIKLVDKNRLKSIHATHERAGFGALGVAMSAKGVKQAA